MPPILSWVNRGIALESNIDHFASLALVNYDSTTKKIQYATAGSIIYRQRGTVIFPGVNVAKGGDDTLFATISGYVKYERKGRDKKQVSVYEEK